MRQWFYLQQGEQQGPISEETFFEVFRSGQLSAETLVWTEELDEWTAARNIENLVPASLSQPPPGFGGGREDVSEPQKDIYWGPESEWLSEKHYNEEGKLALPPPLPESSPQQKPCPFCGESVLATAKKCKHCGEFLDGSKSFSNPAAPLAQMVKEGRFAFACPYDQAYTIVERAMTESEVKIRERTPEKGLLKGNCAYGINVFGITVTAIFYSDAGVTQAEVSANLTDAFDTFGVCKKKVAQISDRIRSLSMVGLGGVQNVATVVATPQRVPSSAQQMAPPSWADRAGPSFKGKANVGFYLSLGSLFVGPCAIVALTMCSIALNGMSKSTNKDGKGMAVAGLIIGFIGLLTWLMIVINL